MGDLRLPRLISDGMILQQKKQIKMWGFDRPGRKVMLSFLGEEYVAVADGQGRFEAVLPPMEPGGPYNLYIGNENGEEIVVTDILIGDVWLCAGQSNMELPMERVKDRYPEEIRECSEPFIRTFKVIEHSDFHGPLRELQSGSWEKADTGTILKFSATAYFFAKQMYQMTGVPVGLINTSLGGSRIQSWMSREMLQGDVEDLLLAEKYADDAFVAGQLERNQENMEAWHRNLDEQDQGLKRNFKELKAPEPSFKEVSIPFFFRDTQLQGFIGSVWFLRNFQVTGGLAGKAAKLWLGTIVDSDTVYINGVMVGHTDYQYPPRKYEIPEGLLREGENTIVIRVKCENGHGRFTDGKKYALWNDEEEIDLTGKWYYEIGAACEQIEPTDFVNWKPTGLYNGMVAPCRPYTLAGILWYQGESNTHVPEVYLELMKRMVAGYRKEWGEELPFLYVQLPNFAIDRYDSDADETGQGWPVVRELQRRAKKLPRVGMAVTMDLGEDNDLHPLNKKEVGFRLAMLAAKMLYGIASECEGPEICGIDYEMEKTGAVLLYFKNITDGMYAYGGEKGKEIRDFELRDEQGIWHRAAAVIKEDTIRLTPVERIRIRPCGVRYLFSNISHGAMIYNRAGFPLSPFVNEKQEDTNENTVE
ncbi:acetyl-xylan esterase [Firmicutes bacterium CAG:534]|nr:acetyl-xylan esterase [Firmicutes bacterium CAG:534]